VAPCRNMWPWRAMSLCVIFYMCFTVFETQLLCFVMLMRLATDVSLYLFILYP